MDKNVCSTHCLLSILMLSSGKWESCCRVSHLQYIIWLQCGICIIRSLPNIWCHGLVMWNRIVVLDKYSLLSETKTKCSLKRDPNLPFPSSKPLQHSHTPVLLDKYCKAGLADISAYSSTHFGRSIQQKERIMWRTSPSFRPSFRLSVCLPIYLSICWHRISDYNVRSSRNVGYRSSLPKAVGQTWASWIPAQ
jgi:hypothetical protein